MVRFDEVIDGKVWRSYFDTTLSASETINIQIKTPENKTIIFETMKVISIENSLRIKTYENSALTDGTTSVHTINSNFQSAVTKNFEIYSDPTDVVQGNLKSSTLVPAITSGPSFKIISPFTISEKDFSILKPGTDYTIEIENLVDSQTKIDIQILMKEL